MTPRNIKLFDVRSTSVLDGFRIILENVLWVSQETSGWIRLALTTISLHPLICGEVPFVKDHTADYVIMITLASKKLHVQFSTLLNWVVVRSL